MNYKIKIKRKGSKSFYFYPVRFMLFMLTVSVIAFAAVRVTAYALDYINSFDAYESTDPVDEIVEEVKEPEKIEEVKEPEKVEEKPAEVEVTVTDEIVVPKELIELEPPKKIEERKDDIIIDLSPTVKEDEDIILYEDKILIKDSEEELDGYGYGKTFGDIATQLDENYKKLESKLAEEKARALAEKEFNEYVSSNYVKEKSIVTNGASGFTVEELNKYLKGKPTQGYGREFLEAEKKYGVSAALLISIAQNESGNGVSALARQRNNLYGFTAYDIDPGKHASRFSTFKESIEAAARLLSQDYLNPDGRYFKGYTIEDINKSYASDESWASKVKACYKDVIRKAKNE